MAETLQALPDAPVLEPRTTPVVSSETNPGIQFGTLPEKAPTNIPPVAEAQTPKVSPLIKATENSSSRGIVFGELTTNSQPTTEQPMSVQQVDQAAQRLGIPAEAARASMGYQKLVMDAAKEGIEQAKQLNLQKEQQQNLEIGKLREAANIKPLEFAKKPEPVTELLPSESGYAEGVRNIIAKREAVLKPILEKAGYSYQFLDNGKDSAINIGEYYTDKNGKEALRLLNYSDFYNSISRKIEQATDPAVREQLERARLNYEEMRNELSGAARTEKAAQKAEPRVGFLARFAEVQKSVGVIVERAGKATKEIFAKGAENFSALTRKIDTWVSEKQISLWYGPRIAQRKDQIAALVNSRMDVRHYREQQQNLKAEEQKLLQEKQGAEEWIAKGFPEYQTIDYDQQIIEVKQKLIENKAYLERQQKRFTMLNNESVTMEKDLKRLEAAKTALDVRIQQSQPNPEVAAQQQ